MPTLTRILLIDDDDVDRKSVRRALSASDLNWELTEAVDGADGLARAQSDVFDCVLLDYRLPDVDAFDLLADLIAPAGGRQAVMMLTGEGDPETALRLMRAGALDHLSKAEMTSQTLARAIRYAKARRQFLSELEEKNSALDALNRQKSLLLSIIAHDLRNPFQVMLGMSDVLSSAVAGGDPNKIERRASGIRHAAMQAHDLMEDLFAWASLQMETAEIVLDDVALDAVARGAIEPCASVAGRKGIEIVVDCGDIRVQSQREMLTTILRNLVGNAVKFTPQGGQIAITAVKNELVTLSVSDTGVGMDETALAHLFRLDTRRTTPGTDGEKGTGLGLLLCRDLAERLGTTLQVFSEPGRGTAFSLDLQPSDQALR